MVTFRVGVLGALVLLAGGCGSGSDNTGSGGGSYTGTGGQTVTGTGGTGAVGLRD
jgi:hypothetical protein